MNVLYKEIQEIISIICDGNFTQNDVLAFMIKIREFNLTDPILRDLCNFFAHRVKRGRGESHKVVQMFLEKFVKASEENSDVIIPPPLFNKHDIIIKIIKYIEFNGFKFDNLSFVFYADNFIECIKNILDGAVYEITNSKVKSCHIQRIGADLFFCFILQNLSEKALFRREGPGETCIIMFYSGDKKLLPLNIKLN
jgi:hypothetical protein